MKKSNEKFISDISEIIEKYALINSYLAIHGFKENDCKIIRHKDFDNLEKDINNYIKVIISIMAVFMGCIAMVLIVGMILIAIFA